MRPSDEFTAKVRTRVTELTGVDPGPFRIGDIFPGTNPNVTEDQLIEEMAKSISRRGEWQEATIGEDD